MNSSFCFRLGDYDVAVRSDLDEVLTDLAAMYPATTPTPGGARIDMEVIAAAGRRFGPRRYKVYGDGEKTAEDLQACEVLPYLEWGVNWRLIDRTCDRLVLHAAAMAFDGRGVVLPGLSGSGKSTLAAALAARGWRYLCDEFALVHPDTFMLHPFPKAICIKSGAFELMRGLNLPLCNDRHYVKAIKGRVGYISPGTPGLATAGEPCPVHAIAFPRYTGHGHLRRQPVTPARAAFQLAGHLLNRHIFESNAATILGRLTTKVPCVSLESGDLQQTCDMLERLVDGRDD